MRKLETVLVTAEVNLTQGRSYIGSCLRQVTLSPHQCEIITSYLRRLVGYIADKIQWRHYHHSTILWIETGVALCRRSLRREMRRFGRALEEAGLAETARICSPFKVSYR